MVKGVANNNNKENKNKKAKAKAGEIVVALPSIMPERLFQRICALTEEYLASVFFSFIVTQNHVGVWFPHGREFKYTEKRWIGLTNPPLFYIIEEIKPDETSKYVPTTTTNAKWESYTDLRTGSHPPLEDIVAALHRHNFIRHWQGDELDESLEHAVAKYIDENKELAARTLKGKIGDEACELVVEDIYKVHSKEHFCTAWCFTDEFLDMVKKVRNIKKK